MPREPKILIVGAGPTGLTAALWLQKLGVPFRIIDANQGQSDSSRALGIHARTLELDQQIGIADDVIAAGIIGRHASMYREGKIIGKIILDGGGTQDSEYQYILFLPQDMHEQIQRDHLNERGDFVEWGTRLVSLDAQNSDNTVVLEKDGTQTTHQYKYVIGADGGGSQVRHDLGLRFDGSTAEEQFFVADTRVTRCDVPSGLGLSFLANGFAIIMPLVKENTVRLVGLVPEHLQGREDITFQDVYEPIKNALPMDATGADWFSLYKVHHRVVDRFSKGNVFVCGDAAHLHSPAGAQGMNTGIGDAVNIAWKLAAVIKGQADAKILDSYHDERHPFAVNLIKTTDAAFAQVASNSRRSKFMRKYVIGTFFPMLSRITFLRHRIFRRISQIEITYQDAGFAEGRSGKIRAGMRLPYFVYSRGDKEVDNFESLKTTAWQLHYFGVLSGELGQFTDTQGIETHGFNLNQMAKRRGFSEGVGYLVRPDGYIGAIAKNNAAGAAELAAYAAKFGIKSAG